MEKSNASVLILILPFAAGVIFLYATWRWLLGAAALALMLQVWQQYKWRTLSDSLSPMFNQLLKDNQGCVTAVDLALAADLRIEMAHKFLVQQAARYGGQEKNTEAGNTVYYFLTASAIGSIFATDDAATTIDVEALDDVEALEGAELDKLPQFNSVAAPQSLVLIQAELAKRLSVHSGTLTKRKNDPSFPEWSCKKDPEGIAWRYAPKQKLFVPLDLSGP